MKNKKSILLLLLFAMATTVVARGDDLSADIDAYMQAYVETGNYSGVVLLMKGDEVLHHRGYGYANFEHGIKTAPDTRFPLGSIGKQLSAIAIMRLVDRELISTDDTIDTYLPGLKHGSAITIHQLLTHTSGIPELPETTPWRADQKGRKTSSRDDRLRMLSEMELRFEPGSSYEYTNVGYWLLSEVVAEVLHADSVDEYILEELLPAAGMQNTVRDQGQPFDRRSQGYIWTHNGLINSYYFERPLVGAYFTTAMDLWRLNRGVINAELVSQASRDKMLTRHAANYGYAFFIYGSDPEKPYVGHGGNSIGYRASITSHPSTGLSLVLYTNINNCPFSKIINDIFTMAQEGGKVEPPPVHKMNMDASTRRYDDFTGVYADRENDRYFRVLGDKDGLTLSVMRPNNLGDGYVVNNMVMFPLEDNRFFTMDMTAEIEFPLGRGQAERLLLIQDNNTRSLERASAPGRNNRLTVPSGLPGTGSPQSDDPIPPGP